VRFQDSGREAEAQGRVSRARIFSPSTSGLDGASERRIEDSTAPGPFAVWQVLGGFPALTETGIVHSPTLPASSESGAQVGEKGSSRRRVAAEIDVPPGRGPRGGTKGRGELRLARAIPRTRFFDGEHFFRLTSSPARRNGGARVSRVRDFMGISRGISSLRLRGTKGGSTNFRARGFRLHEKPGAEAPGREGKIEKDESRHGSRRGVTPGATTARSSRRCPATFFFFFGCRALLQNSCAVVRGPTTASEI